MIIIKGKMSTFGGPDDPGVKPDEGLALVQERHLASLMEYFLDAQPPDTTGLARRLNPDAAYIACRWDYTKTSRPFLRAALVTVTNPATGASERAKPVDWGPHESTGRVADLSPGLACRLGLETDDLCRVEIPEPH